MDVLTFSCLMKKATKSNKDIWTNMDITAIRKENIMQIIDLEQKLQTELNYFNEEKPYTIFFIDYGQPSQMSCKLVPSEMIRFSSASFTSNVKKQLTKNLATLTSPILYGLTNAKCRIVTMRLLHFTKMNGQSMQQMIL